MLGEPPPPPKKAEVGEIVQGKFGDSWFDAEVLEVGDEGLFRADITIWPVLGFFVINRAQLGA